MRDYTVEDRYNIMMIDAIDVCPKDIKRKQVKNLEDALFTYSEATGTDIDYQTAMNIYAIVNLIIADKFTEEMRL